MLIFSIICLIYFMVFPRNSNFPIAGWPKGPNADRLLELVGRQEPKQLTRKLFYCNRHMLVTIFATISLKEYCSKCGDIDELEGKVNWTFMKNFALARQAPGLLGLLGRRLLGRAYSAGGGPSMPSRTALKNWLAALKNWLAEFWESFVCFFLFLVGFVYFGMFSLWK